MNNLTAQPRDAKPLCLVIIDHREAKIYRSEEHGAVPDRIRPPEAKQQFQHAHDDWHTREFPPGHDAGKHGFFAAVTKALPPTGDLLLFGTGTGGSSKMDEFIAWQRQHRPDLSSRIRDAVVVDQHHLTEAQLLALARDYARRPSHPSVTSVLSIAKNH